ncbi:MAG TPA: hydratase [Peptococcaceae bacterium]|nr:hydratase [Peptococcaceae bacterium]
MIRLIPRPTLLINGKDLYELSGQGLLQGLGGNQVKPESLAIDDSKLLEARKQTIAYRILQNHNQSGDPENLKIRFDALASHDITYVGIVQTARASGLKEFPVPYVLTNCHNSLCAVGGTINEDDHVFGLSAAQKYGGIFVPAHQAVIHQYVREMMAGCGLMIMGSDSHTRYGALGTMGVGEGGPELVKQILSRTYNLKYPEVLAVYLSGRPRPGVGPQDVALALIGAVFKNGFAVNKILEFVGPGIANLSIDYRNGIDVMTTETACLSSIWVTDEKVREYFAIHGRPEAYQSLQPGETACYDGAVIVELDKIEPMIALPFHPSNVYTISELNKNPYDILKMAEEEGKKQLGKPDLNFSLTDKIVEGRIKIDQGIIAGCAGGTFENILEAAAITEQQAAQNEMLSISVYPASQPIYLEMIRNGTAAKLIAAGAVIKTAFCGPCFGAGDVPANGSLSIRHTTRNFPNREGSKPGEGQIASVALMDARSIAATAINGGYLTPATEIEYQVPSYQYHFAGEIYRKRVYQGYQKAKPEMALRFGPNIADWPQMIAMPENMLLQVAASIQDTVTTTDELIPSGDTSSYRSNPLKLAEFTLSRKDPGYVKRAKVIQQIELQRQAYIRGERTDFPIPESLQEVLAKLQGFLANTAEKQAESWKDTGLGTVIFAVKPGDGSAREQAASCQKVLGGWANIAREYATKRYRSNLINWGMLPFTSDENYEVGDYVWLPAIRQRVKEGAEVIPAYIINTEGVKEIKLYLRNLSQEERKILLHGSLVNYYAAQKV